ncbi:MAG TPA: hypothetical protein VMG08_01595 [Allosphingosinicella sp.]|nr:hypothetical protein [Allosphingosinicella sp.]
MAASFDASGWERALADATDATAADNKLLEATFWIGREAEALVRDQADRFGPLSADQAIALGVALANGEYRASIRGSSDERRGISTEQPVSFDYLANVRYENIHGQRMSASDFIETGIEALSSWIYDARRMCPQDAAESADVGTLARNAMYFYSMRRVLKSLFDQALHQGHSLAEGRDDHWIALDAELHRLHQAWLARAEANFMNEPLKFRTEWADMAPNERRRHGLTRTISSVRWAENGWQAKVGRKEYLSGRPEGCSMERIGLRASYLSPFLDEELPLAPGLSAMLLQDAWWVLNHFARRVASAVGKIASRDQVTLLQAAFVVSEREVSRILASALRVTQARARAIVDFLTFRESSGRQGRSRGSAQDDPDKGNRGLWSAPLISIGDGLMVLPQPVLEIGGPIYRVEAWLERGGIDDQTGEHRGDRFERRCRRDLVEAINANPLFTTGSIAADEIRASEDFPFQTDLIFRLGHRAFVGEVKCWLTPADPHHWDRFYRIRIPAAVDQALLRAEALRKRRDVLAGALGIDLPDASALEVVPVVVLNLSAGFSLESGGCRIIDADFLLSYLRTPHMTSAVTWHYGRPAAGRVVTLYETEEEASDRFDAVMADPWTLRRFTDRLDAADVPYPRPSDGTFTVATLFRGDLTPAERVAHAQMMAEYDD